MNQLKSTAQGKEDKDMIKIKQTVEIRKLEDDNAALKTTNKEISEKYETMTTKCQELVE